jgi:PEGA domain
MFRRALVAVWIAVAIVSRSAPVRADAAEVEALIAKGNELRRAGTPGPALPYFQKAYELARTPRTTGQLGLAELAAGYPVEAETHLSAALASPNDPSIVKYRQILADALTMARSQIGELTIQGNPPGADVIVNGRSVGTLPLPLPIKLPARNTEVVVRAPGYSDQREIMPIAGGQRHSLTVNLKSTEKPAAPAPTVVVTPLPAVSATAPAPAAGPAPSATTMVEQHTESGAPSGSRMRTAAWIVGGGAVVAAGAGLALQLAALSTDDPDKWSTYRRWSIVGYVAGGALAVTSAILFWTSRPASPPVNSRAYFQCTPGLTGIGCQGVF